MNINIESTTEILDHIESILKTLCGKSLSLRFDFLDSITKDIPVENIDVYDMESNKSALILCLFHGEKCISSISCKINIPENAIEISSKTNSNYQGKKYNLFLRSAIIIIISQLQYEHQRKTRSKSKTQFQKIISRAVNPISILSMAKHFYASNEKFDTYMKTHGLTYENLTLHDATQFYDQLREIPPEIEDEDAKLDYYEENIEPYDPVIMEIDLQDVTSIEKALYNIHNIHILCPHPRSPHQRSPHELRTRKRSSLASSKKSARKKINRTRKSI